MLWWCECNLSLSPADYVLVKDARTEIKRYSKQCFTHIWIWLATHGIKFTFWYTEGLLNECYWKEHSWIAPYTWSWFFPSLIWNNQHAACPVWPSVSCSAYYWLHSDKFKHCIGRPTQTEHVRKWNMLFLGEVNSLLKDQAREKHKKNQNIPIHHTNNIFKHHSLINSCSKIK